MTLKWEKTWKKVAGYKHFPLPVLYFTTQSKILTTLRKTPFDNIVETRCVFETLMPPKHPSLEKHDPDI